MELKLKSKLKFATPILGLAAISASSSSSLATFAAVVCASDTCSSNSSTIKASVNASGQGIGNVGAFGSLGAAMANATQPMVNERRALSRRAAFLCAREQQVAGGSSGTQIAANGCTVWPTVCWRELHLQHRLRVADVAEAERSAAPRLSRRWPRLCRSSGFRDRTKEQTFELFEHLLAKLWGESENRILGWRRRTQSGEGAQALQAHRRPATVVRSSNLKPRTSNLEEAQSVQTSKQFDN